MSIFIRGMGQTKAALKKAELEVRAAAPEAARAGAEVVGHIAEQVAPRDTGATANSIRVVTEGDTAHVGPTTSYARFPEFGTRYIAGQHYMERAAEASKTGIIASMSAIFKAALRF